MYNNILFCHKRIHMTQVIHSAQRKNKIYWRLGTVYPQNELSVGLQQNHHKCHQKHRTKDFASTITEVTIANSPASFMLFIVKVQLEFIAVFSASHFFQI